MKLKDISRTATFAWDLSSSSSPLLVTGAVAGALDESFSNESQLEIWAPDFGDGQGMRLGGEGKAAEGSITVGSRFNRLAWSAPSTTHAKGLIAAGMETGEVNVFDPVKILSGASADEARIFKNDKHTGPVRGLDFNPIQKNLMLTGAVNAELYIFDLNNPNNAPIPPGPLSTKLNEITSLQWNPTVSRVFAASSSSGYTSVWDLKAGKEIVSLQYGGGAAKGMDAVAGTAGLQMGKRRGMSDVCWHPEQATRLITASEDDESPIIMLWDLRNTRAPERILSGHQKGVLSVSWCKQDADLLLSCGKDNRTLCWNPQTGEIIGELPPSNDWSFQTTWCPRNPDLLATASFDGHIGIHSLQTTQLPEQPTQQLSETATADDVFGALGNAAPADETVNVLSLKQPPKWLRRPVSATFGFGGLLTSVSNLPGPTGKNQSSVVHLRNVVTEEAIIKRAKALEETAGDKDKLAELANSKATEADAAWKALQTLFKANSKDELVQLLGFSKEEVAKQVEETIKKFPNGNPADDTPTEKASLVSFAEPETTPSEVTAQAAETTPSELSAASESTKRTEATEATEHSLFDDEPGTPAAAAAAADFFSSMASGSLRNPQLDNVIPHRPEVAESSAAATIGSRASSVRSEVLKEHTFHIYPSGESDVDRLITQALVLGDFSSAVDLCLASERFADALLLAVRGGPDLLQSTQKAYFARRTTSLPFLRVFQSIVTEDLVDIVQNADLGEWKVAFVVICTFAKDGDFSNLADQLGQRLQFKYQMLAGSDSPEAKASAKAARQDATLCYLAARRLEKVVNIWIDEMREEEDAAGTTKYTAHAQALQSFIEKVSVFKAATGYVDEDLLTPTSSAAAAEAGARTYRLAGLYDRFYEYADLLATQGLVEMAAKYVQMTPGDYKGTGAAGSELDKARDRLFKAAGVTQATAGASSVFASQKAPVAAGSSAYAAAPKTAHAPPVSTPYAATNAANAYAPPPTIYQPPSQPVQPQSQTGGYAPSPYNAPQAYQPQATPLAYAPANGYGHMEPQPQGYGAPPQNLAPSLAPPPRASFSGPPADTGPSPIPAAQRRDMPGWNDAPSFSAPKRPQSAAKAAPIMSPFPMSEPMPSPGVAGGVAGPPQSMTSAPPRGAPGVLPPPPKGGPRPPSAQALARVAAAPPQQPQVRPPPTAPPPQAHVPPPPHAAPRLAPGPGRGGPPPGALGGPPPPRALSPLGPAGRVASPLLQQMRPPAPPTQPMSPPRQAPMSPSQRMAGPPPPGRTGTSPQSVQAPSTVSPPAPAQPAAPAKPLHPAGDRSHIPADSRPIFESLSGELTRVKQSNLPPHLKRIVDDTERRLNILFDGLNNETVPKEGLDKMHAISKAMAARDANAALALHVELLTTATGEMTAWAPGVKQLIRLGL
ncbi:Protein transport protein sec31 [Saitozyma sp. JCM 24511]|nr:Protein transport protein sec31 [Saitozyma sp. JCM 24511]